MKVKVEDKKIVLYLYNYFFSSYQKQSITKEIKNIFIKLIKYYNLEFKGIYNVYVYENTSYGTILEIELEQELLFNRDIIDIKVKILTDKEMYLKTNNYEIIEEYENIYFKDNNYYINIKNVSNLINILEFIDIIYNENENFLFDMIFIK